MIRAKPYNLNQQQLIPTDIKTLLPENDLSLFIVDVTNHLDLTEITKNYHKTFGRLPYNPIMMTNILFYSYCIGIFSSRKIEKRTYTDIAYIYLAGGEHPDHVSISRFREENLEELSKTFVQILMMCKKGGLVKMGKIAIDGTKIKASASKRKTKDYEGIIKEYEKLETKVKELMKEAEKIDEIEDKKYGKNKRGDELPEKLKKKQDRLKELVRIKMEMEEEAKKIAEEKAKEIKKREQEEKKTGKKKRGRKPKPKSELPDNKFRHNFTDPDSRLMKDNSINAIVQGYNCQTVVDLDSQIIIASDVTQEANDKHQAVQMIQKLREYFCVDNLKELERIKLTLDAGYFTEGEIKKLIEMGFEVYISPKGYNSKSKILQMKGRISKNMSFIDRMRRKVRTKAGKKIYSKRKIVEAPFGQIKEARGFRRFSLRGKKKVKMEWDIVTLTHNILVMYRNGVVF